MVQKKKVKRPDFTTRKVSNPVVLIVLDGWGLAPPGEFNAISLAKTPNFEMIKLQFGSEEICASGTCVGVSEGQMGNRR